MNFLQNFNLQAYNTFGIAAQCAYFTSFDSVEALKQCIEEAPLRPLIVLGGGSNMLITKTIEGTVLQNKILGIDVIAEDEEAVSVRVGAGENWHSFVIHAVDKGWGGIENLSLIPGCVGASPMQNIGAYGVEIKDVLVEVEALEISSGAIHHFSNEACKFGYRESVFKRELKDQYVITHVIFRLTKKHRIHSEYGAIREVLLSKGIQEPSIKDISDSVIEIRSSKLPDPKHIGNAGSFFKNPVISKELYESIRSAYANAPCYPIDDQTVKIPAGWLIETAGWKGKDFGNYGVHDKQALVLVNRGGAQGRAIFELSEKIIEDIHQKFGVLLEREVNIY